MKDSVHIYIDKEISKQMKDVALTEKINPSKAYELILLKGLEYYDQSNMFNKIIKYLNNNEAQILYIKKLLQQVYADLSLEQINLNESTNLMTFNKKYRKDINKFFD